MDDLACASFLRKLQATDLAQPEEGGRAQGVAVVKSLEDIAADLGRNIIEFAFGDIFARPGPDVKTRELATVAALTARGTAPPQLKVHMQEALRISASQEEIIEAVIQMIPYVGSPAALSAVTITRSVFAAR